MQVDYPSPAKIGTPRLYGDLKYFEREALDVAIEAARQQCAKDHRVPLHDVSVFEAAPNPKYDPDQGPYVHNYDAAGVEIFDIDYWRSYNYGGQCSFTVEFSYNAADNRALYGIHHARELCELWAD